MILNYFDMDISGVTGVTKGCGWCGYLDARIWVDPPTRTVWGGWCAFPRGQEVNHAVEICTPQSLKGRSVKRWADRLDLT